MFLLSLHDLILITSQLFLYYRSQTLLAVIAAAPQVVLVFRKQRQVLLAFLAIPQLIPLSELLYMQLNTRCGKDFYQGNRCFNLVGLF